MTSPSGPPPGGPWAHSANANGEWHDLREHLESVAALARRFAEPFGAGEWAHLAGLWHDLGKASGAFQAYLRAATDDDYHAAESRGSLPLPSVTMPPSVGTCSPQALPTAHSSIGMPS